MERGRGVKLLIDTHYLLWSAIQPDRLQPWVRELLGDFENTILVSSASIFEIGQKVRRGKLLHAALFEQDLIENTRRLGYTMLPLTPEVMLRAARFASPHADPFDRMIAAQAIELDLPVLSSDRNLDLFGVRRIAGDTHKQ